MDTVSETELPPVSGLEGQLWEEPIIGEEDLQSILESLYNEKDDLAVGRQDCTNDFVLPETDLDGEINDLKYFIKLARAVCEGGGVWRMLSAVKFVLSHSDEKIEEMAKKLLHPKFVEHIGELRTRAGLNMLERIPVGKRGRLSTDKGLYCLYYGNSLAARKFDDVDEEDGVYNGITLAEEAFRQRIGRCHLNASARAREPHKRCYRFAGDRVPELLVVARAAEYSTKDKNWLIYWKD